MSRTRFVASLSFCLVLSVGLHAAGLTREQALQLGTDFGNAYTGSMSDAATNADLNTVPGFQATDVPQTQLWVPETLSAPDGRALDFGGERLHWESGPRNWRM